ncbi:MAG: BON domain-containing protein [Bacillota bacterium]|jgi:hyperosmotically inducible protein
MMPDPDIGRHPVQMGSDDGGGPDNTQDGQGKGNRISRIDNREGRDGRHATVIRNAHDASVARDTADARSTTSAKDAGGAGDSRDTRAFRAAHIDTGNQGVPSTVRGAKGLSPDLVDDQLKEQLRNVLDSDPNLGAYGLRADVVEREAQIQGIVDSLSEKRRAEELARSIPGIAKVDASIAVSTDGPITDKGVAFEVSEELESHPDVSTENIGAKVDRGVVTLVGNTDDPAEVDAAKEAASKARGVTEVHSRVKVLSQGVEKDEGNKEGKRGKKSKESSRERIFHSQVGTDREKNPRH